MRKSVTLLLFGLLVLGLLVTGGAAVYAQSDTQQDDNSAEQDAAAAQPLQTGTVYDVIVADERLSSFEALVEAGALADNLDQAGPFTVFAPSNEAWEAYEAMSAESPTDATLTQILLYHVINGNYSASAVANRDSVSTLLGETVSFGADSDGTMVNSSAGIVAADIAASNGVVHIIDTVLIPQVHSLSTTQLGSSDSNIIEVLRNDGRFGILLALLQQAALTDDLQEANADYTLFAPTDEAFNAVPQELRDEWLANTDELETILRYHIVTDRLGINQIANDELIPTWEGRPLFVTTDEQQGVALNGTAIETFNVAASNGVVHVVDTVLLP